MGLYNFQKRFVPLIARGEKTHTIRASRKYPARVGEILHLYTGLRQRGAICLMRVPCVRVQEIRLDYSEVPHPSLLRVVIDGEALSHDETEAFFRRDGFPGGSREAEEFWRDRLPFEGQIIHWQYQGAIHAS